MNNNLSYNNSRNTIFPLQFSMEKTNVLHVTKSYLEKRKIFNMFEVLELHVKPTNTDLIIKDANIFNFADKI